MHKTQTVPEMACTLRRLYAPVAAVLSLLLVVLALAGYGPGGRACAVVPNVAAQAPGAEGAEAPPEPAPLPGTPGPALPPPAAKIYFAGSRSELDADARTKAAAVVEYLKANPKAKALVSAFFDAAGDRDRNEERALNRAQRVLAMLLEQGIAQERVHLARPVESFGARNPDEARRVELSIRP